MNAINFKYIFAYFQDSQRKSWYRQFEAFTLRKHKVFEALARTGQPFGGKV
ncbi:hypothetical protein [Runella sp.]|uniref:hypothetical protein n=1 Tax=Runella sp. TaxID=1960881 RepID=UPI003D13933D